MKRTKTLAAVLAAATAIGFTSPTLAAKDCWSPAEVRAAKVREMQTLLMVGALQCRHINDAETLANYNVFVKRFRKDLGSQNQVLRSRFARTHGSSGQRAFDQYTTQLANTHAAAGATPGFCDSARAAAAQAAAMPESELHAMAERLIPTRAVAGDQCS